MTDLLQPVAILLLLLSASILIGRIFRSSDLFIKLAITSVLGLFFGLCINNFKSSNSEVKDAQVAEISIQNVQTLSTCLMPTVIQVIKNLFFTEVCTTVTNAVIKTEDLVQTYNSIVKPPGNWICDNTS